MTSRINCLKQARCSYDRPQQGSHHHSQRQGLQPQLQPHRIGMFMASSYAATLTIDGLTADAPANGAVIAGGPLLNGSAFTAANIPLP